MDDVLSRELHMGDTLPVEVAEVTRCVSELIIKIKNAVVCANGF